MDDLPCERADFDAGKPVDHSSVSSRSVRISRAAHLHVPDDHLYFCDLDHLLSELMSLSILTQSRPNESDARTHRTPKALRAKFTESRFLFRAAFGVRTRPRVAVSSGPGLQRDR
jgi:hypothetical protein